MRWRDPAREATAMVGLLVASVGTLACSKTEPQTCIGTPGAEGEWQGFAGSVEGGAPCTTPAGDLHVRYDGVSSDRLTETWSTLIPQTLGVELREPWAGEGAYRHAVYAKPGSDRVLIVQVVQSGSTPVRTVRLTWDPVEAP